MPAVSRLLTLLLGPLLSLPSAIAASPNVVLVLTDDQGYGDIRSHENPRVATPHLDRLAADGARFERFFVSPVCAPTRASLLTGRYALRTGTHGVTRGRETMRSDEMTIAEVLRSAGYATGCFGKWHNGAHYPQDPNGQGFDEFLGFTAGHWNNYFDTTLLENGEPVRVKGFIADVLTDRAIDFTRRQVAAKRPFLTYLSLNTPHSPWQVPEAYWKRHAAKIGAPGSDLDRRAACAYAMCENIDDNVGRLLATLDELRVAKETIVLFLTDNGPNSNRYNGGMRGRKGSVHEGGVRVPLFVRWPGHIPKGRRIEPIAMHIDLLPTLAELCGVQLPGRLRLDGRSLASLLLGKSETMPERRLFTFRSWGGAVQARVGAVRTPRWRAVREGRRGPARWQLYDLQADPAETQDLSKAHPDVVATLALEFEAKYAEVTATPLAPLPIPVGWAERPRVTLPGHECELRPAFGQGLRYVGRNGWANDWVTEWTSTDAFPEWRLDVAAAGVYEVALAYTLAPALVGCRLRVEAEDARGVTAHVDTKITTAHDPEPIPSPDRIDRGEVYEKVWKQHPVGRLRLARGSVTLRVRALELPGGRSIDLKEVLLSRREDIDPPARLR